MTGVFRSWETTLTKFLSSSFVFLSSASARFCSVISTTLPSIAGLPLYSMRAFLLVIQMVSPSFVRPLASYSDCASSPLSLLALICLVMDLSSGWTSLQVSIPINLPFGYL